MLDRFNDCAIETVQQFFARAVAEALLAVQRLEQDRGRESFFD